MADKSDRTEKGVLTDLILRKSVLLLRAALEAAPDPRQVDGPPAFWEWYDRVRAGALDLTKEP